jgi:hypothetical protein
MPGATYGSVKQDALAEYFIKRFNMPSRDAEYQRNRPTLSWLPRDTEKLKQGDGFYETIKVAGGWGGTPDWVTGNQFHSVSTRMRWAVTDPYPQYARVTFDNLTLARNNLGTLIDLKGTEAEDVREAMLNTLEFQLWADGSGVRGQIAATGLGGSAATRVLTLAVASDVYNFPHGSLLDFSSTAIATALRTDRYRVTAINPIAGQITAVRISGAGGDVAASDFIFARSAGQGAAAEKLVMPGIPTFIPSTDPADTLKGVVRSADPATSGWRFPFRNSISETIQRSFTQMGRFVNRGAGKFVVVLSTMDWLALSMEREGRIMEDPGAFQKWGLTGLVVNTPFGPITCVSVPQLGDGRGYIIDWSAWKLYTLKNLPHVVDEDGQTFVRGGIGTVSGNEHLNGDFVAMQMRIWTELLCLQPLSNATFPTR